MSASNMLSKEEAAKTLGVSVKTLRRLVRQKKLRAVRYGKSSPLLFRLVDVQQCIENSLTASAEPKEGAI